MIIILLAQLLQEHFQHECVSNVNNNIYIRHVLVSYKRFEKGFTRRGCKNILIRSSHAYI